MHNAVGLEMKLFFTCIVFVTLLLTITHATIQMIMKYDTDGPVELNQVNFTVHTLSINVTLLGCDYGYYDHYLLYPPTQSSKTQITPFECRACVCTDFSSERVEEFVVDGK
jgi:hypothetical protein